MGARAPRFFARLNRLELSTPLVEASSGNPEFLGKIIDAFAGLHPLYGCALKLPGISLPSLHGCSSPGECAHRDCANSRGHSKVAGVAHSRVVRARIVLSGFRPPPR